MCRAILAPVFWGWSKFATQDQRHWMYPTDFPEVSIVGPNPARILVIGDAPAAGFGVRTHQLGIAGYVARHVFDLLARGVVVTVMAQPTASARSTLRRVGGMDINRYDAIVLMLATTDGLCLTSRRTWKRNLTGLVHVLQKTDAASTFVTSAASLHLFKRLSPIHRRLAGRNALMLNIETRRICAETGSTLIPLDAPADFTSRTYARWAQRIGTHVAESLHTAATTIAATPLQPETRLAGLLTGKASS